MKKYLILVFALLLLFFTSACQTNDFDLKVSVSDAKISSKEFAVEFDVNFIAEKTSLSNYQIKQINCYYEFDKFKKETLIEEGEQICLDVVTQTVFESKTYKLSFTEKEFKKDLSFVIEVLLIDGKKLYSSLEFKNIYELALNDYEDNPSSLQIYNYFMIGSLDLEIDLEASVLTKAELKYSYTYTNTQEVKTLTVTLNKDFKFSNEFVFKLNGADIDRSLYSIQDNVLTYKQSEKKLDQITVTVDLLLKTDSYIIEEETFKLKYSNPSYDKITIIITLKGDYVFADNFVLNFNGKIIPTNEYKIEGNMLTYIFNDPNWSGIY